MARQPNPDVEHLSKQVVFVLQPSLFTAFERRCRERYKTVSEMLRELVVAVVQQEE
jgi:hypothetical protein